MRNAIFAGAATLLATAVPAFAQAGTEGPLAAPSKTSSETLHAAAKPAKTAKHKTPLHRHASRGQDSRPSYDAGARRDIALPESGTDAEPLSFGMQWNGNSDNARETRIQNYDAKAPGSGAAVGMKLHF